MFDSTPFELVALKEIVAEKEIRDPRKTPDWIFRYIDISSVSNEKFEIVGGKQFLGADAPSRARKVIRKNDIIFATTRPYLKSITRIPEDLNGNMCSTGFCVLRPTGRVLSEWVFYCAISDEFLRQITPQMRGANYPAVTDKDVLAAKIPLPGIDDQRRIVSRIKECMERLDEIENLRASALVEAEYLAPSLYNALQNGGRWPLISVGDIISHSRNGRSIGQNNGNADGYVLSLSAVHDISLNLKQRKPIALPNGVLAQYSIKPGDVFVSRSNTMQLVGLASVAMDAPDVRIIYPDLLIKLETRPDLILPRFLAYALRIPESRRQIKERALGTSQSMVKISGQRLKEVEIPLPPLNVQAELIDRFDELHDLAFSLEGDLKSLNSAALRQGILSRAFSGEF